eukprot:COSAG06_NODE_45667_length_353_cov_0.602362_1_plen_69_part_10
MILLAAFPDDGVHFNLSTVPAYLRSSTYLPICLRLLHHHRHHRRARCSYQNPARRDRFAFALRDTRRPD